MVCDRLRVINIVLLGMGEASAFHRARPSTVHRDRYGDDALCVPLQMGLVTGAREGSTRTSHDGHRARCGRLRRSLFVVPSRRSSHFPTLGFFFILVSGWRVQRSGERVPVALAQFSQRRYLFVGRPAREDSAQTTVCLGSLGVCRGTSRVKSRVTSPQP